MHWGRSPPAKIGELEAGMLTALLAIAAAQRAQALEQVLANYTALPGAEHEWPDLPPVSVAVERDDCVPAVAPLITAAPAAAQLESGQAPGLRDALQLAQQRCEALEATHADATRQVASFLGVRTDVHQTLVSVVGALPRYAKRLADQEAHLVWRLNNALGRSTSSCSNASLTSLGQTAAAVERRIAVLVQARDAALADRSVVVGTAKWVVGTMQKDKELRDARLRALESTSDRCNAALRECVQRDLRRPQLHASILRAARALGYKLAQARQERDEARSTVVQLGVELSRAWQRMWERDGVCGAAVQPSNAQDDADSTSDSELEALAAALEHGRRAASSEPSASAERVRARSLHVLRHICKPASEVSKVTRFVHECACSALQLALPLANIVSAYASACLHFRAAALR